MGFTYAGTWGPQPIEDSNGVPLKNATLAVYVDSGHTTLANLYTDYTKSLAASNPVDADSLGNFTVCAMPGVYYAIVTWNTQTTDIIVPVQPYPNDPVIIDAAPINSPAFTGVPTAPTASPLNDSTQLATTAYADLAVGVETTRAEAAEATKAPLASPALTGTPTAPTAPALTDSTQLATTAYTDSAVAVETTRAEAAETLKAPLASPALTGAPTAPTATPLTNNTQLATTAYTDAAVAVETARAEAAEAKAPQITDGEGDYGGLITVGFTEPNEPGPRDLLFNPASQLQATDVAGVIPAWLIEAVGDLIVGTASGVPVRIPVGSDGQVLTARSTAVGYGVDWEAATVAPTTQAQLIEVFQLTPTNAQLLAANASQGGSTNVLTSTTYTNLTSNVSTVSGGVIPAIAAGTQIRIVDGNGHSLFMTLAVALASGAATITLPTFTTNSSWVACQPQAWQSQYNPPAGVSLVRVTVDAGGGGGGAGNVPTSAVNQVGGGGGGAGAAISTVCPAVQLSIQGSGVGAAPGVGGAGGATAGANGSQGGVTTITGTGVNITATGGGGGAGAGVGTTAVAGGRYSQSGLGGTTANVVGGDGGGSNGSGGPGYGPGGSGGGGGGPATATLGGTGGGGGTLGVAGANGTSGGSANANGTNGTNGSGCTGGGGGGGGGAAYNSGTSGTAGLGGTGDYGRVLIEVIA